MSSAGINIKPSPKNTERRLRPGKVTGANLLGRKEMKKTPSKNSKGSRLIGSDGTAHVGTTSAKEMNSLMARDAGSFFKGGAAPSKEEQTLSKMTGK